MSSKLDLSLDEIIKSRSKSKKSGRRRGGTVRKVQVAKAVKEKPYTKPAVPRLPASVESGKIIITNLHQNVTERDLRELFGQVGTVRSASLNFDSRGVSQGSGSVVFARSEDAMNALRKYHGVTLDGRPMKIAIPFTPSLEPSVPISSRVGPLRNESTKNTTGRPGLRRAKSKPVNKRKKEALPFKSKDDLDAELDAYNAAFQAAAMEE